MMKSFPHHQLLGIKDEIENDPKVNLHVPARLTNPNKLILYIKDDFFNRYDRSLNKRIDNSEMLSINVWKAHFDRASQFMNNLIKALRNRRHDFIRKNGDVYLVVFGEEYPISCIEKSKKVIVKYRYGESTGYEPTGILSFRIDESYKLKEWIEGKTPIEEQLSKILAGIEFKGMKDRDETIRIHTIWERKKENQRIAKELQDRKEKELMNFKSYLLNLKGMRKKRLYEGTLKNLKIMLFKVMNLQKILKTKSNGPEKRPIGMILLLNPMMNY